MKAKILINASAAKHGGAMTIIETYIDSIPEDEISRYILISSSKTKRKQLKQIKLETSGIGTLMFSTLGILFFQIYYQTKNVISFNNTNTLFFSNNTVTYFHQLKMFDTNYNDIKLRIYRFIIKRFNRKSRFVVQSSMVRKKLIDFDSSIGLNSVVVWPGFNVPELIKKDLLIDTLINQIQFNYLGCVPIAHNTDHKNLKFLFKIDSFLLEKLVKVILLSNDNAFAQLQSVKQTGLITREQLFYLYSKCDFMLFTSKVETVGLPIFEFLQTGKPVFAYAADFAIDFQKQFCYPSNFILFKTEMEFKELFFQNIERTAPIANYCEGEWGKMHELL